MGDRRVDAVFVPVVVLAVLVGTVVLALGVEATDPFLVLFSLPAIVALGVSLTWGDTPRRGRVGAFVAVVGTLVFVGGVGVGAGCIDLGYPPDADYGVTVDADDGVVRFGDNVDGTRYRCEMDSTPAAVAGGLVLTSVGTYRWRRGRTGGQDPSSNAGDD